MSILNKIAQKTKVSSFMGDPVTLVQLPMIALAKMEVISKKADTVDQLMSNIDMVVLCAVHGVKEFDGQEHLIRNAPADVFQEISKLAGEVLEFSNITAQEVDSPKKSAKVK